jgi:hypothetical protein
MGEGGGAGGGKGLGRDRECIMRLRRVAQRSRAVDAVLLGIMHAKVLISRLYNALSSRSRAD